MIDGSTLTKRGAEVQYFSWPVAYACASCRCPHERHFEVRERYVIPEELQGSTLPIAYDSRRVLAQGCDDCPCEGLK